MSWLGGNVEKYDTMDAVYNEWNSVYDELPTRTASGNSLKSKGTFRTEKEARKYLDSLDRNDILGMAYVKVDTGKESAKLRDAKALLTKEKEKLGSFLVEGSVYKTHSGKTVGCKKCGSSFPVDYFRTEKRDAHSFYNGFYRYSDEDLEYAVKYGCYLYVNCCPVCGNEMRSDTSLKRIEGYRQNIRKYSSRVKDLESTEKNRPYYLGKVEAYCG